MNPTLDDWLARADELLAEGWKLGGLGRPTLTIPAHPSTAVYRTEHLTAEAERVDMIGRP